MTVHEPIHPGGHLAEIMDELGITQYRLAKTTGVPPIQRTTGQKMILTRSSTIGLNLGRRPICRTRPTTRRQVIWMIQCT